RGDADRGDDRQPPLELLVLGVVDGLLLVVVAVLPHHPGEEEVHGNEDDARDPERQHHRVFHGGPVRRDRREPPRTREMEYEGADDEEDEYYGNRHREAPLLSTHPIACCPTPPHARERVDEVAVEARELGLRMPLVHHVPDDRLLVPARVDQYEEPAGLDVVVEALEFLVLLLDADEAAFPGAEQRRDAAQRDIHEPRDVPERAELVEHDAADDAGEEPDRRAEESLADEVERLEIVAGVDVPLLEARLVLCDHVDEEIVEAHVMQVVGNSRGAVELGRDVIEALHPCPRRWPFESNVSGDRQAPIRPVALQNQGSRARPCTQSRATASSVNTRASAPRFLATSSPKRSGWIIGSRPSTASRIRGSDSRYCSAILTPNSKRSKMPGTRPFTSRTSTSTAVRFARAASR